MEKKNTMLLTVIAVATLLVAVVGATFAYFSLTVNGEATSTKAEVTTGKAGMFTMTGSENALKLNLTATQMAQGLVGDTKTMEYFANSNGENITSKEANGSENEPEDKDFITISKLSLSEANEGVKYHCQGLYTIKVTASEGSSDETDKTSELKASIQEDDGKLYLKTTGQSANIKMSIKNDDEGKPQAEGPEAESIDHTLQSLLNKEDGTKFWVTYDFTASSSTVDAELKAAFKVVNTNKDQSSYLANRKITVTITPSDSEGSGKTTCVPTQPEA